MKPPSTTLLDHLRRLTYTPAADAVLLDRWVRQRDEQAFASLVARHGPMVLGVCRRILGDAHEAEDALQATFLILARKAASLRRPEALSCWLHGVAARLAHKARVAAKRRAGYSHHLAAEPADSQPDPLDLLTVREMLGLIDEEIRALREVYRLPLVLCDLEGRTQEEAAGLLGWTVGSLRGRLLRGRERLRARLTRRGLTLPAGIALPFVPAALSESLCAGPVVPPQVVAAVTQAAVRFSMDSVASPLSGPAVDLAREGLRALLFSKVKIAAAMILTITLFIAGAGLLGQQLWEAIPAEQHGEDKPQPVANAAPKPVEEKPQVRLDRFGDPLPESAVARLGTVRFRQGATIFSLAYSPDGKKIASGGWDNSVRLWDVATGKEIRRFTPAKGLGAEGAWVASVAFSHDGKRLAAGTGNASSDLVIWKIATGQEVRRFAGIHRPLTSIAFTPDGKGLAASDVDGPIRLWSVADGEVIHEFKGHQDWVHAITFSPDGKKLASASRDKTVRLWDTATGGELQQVKGHTDAAQTIAFARDGTKLAGGGLDKSIHVWDPASGKVLFLLKGHEEQVCSLAFFPNGKKLVSSSRDSTIRFWDTQTGKELTRMRRPLGVVSSIAISPDGETLAFDLGDHIVHIWDVVKDEERRPTEGNDGGLGFVSFAPDGRRVATGGQAGTVRLWDAFSGKAILDLIEPKMNFPQTQFRFNPLSYDHLQFAADGKTVLVSNWSILGRWQTDTGQPIDQRSYDCVALLPTPDGKFVVGREREEGFWVIDAATGKKLHRVKAARSVTTAAYLAAVSPDGKFLAANAAGANGTVGIWELATGKERCRCKGAPHLANALEFSPDGKYLAGSTSNIQVVQYENAIYLWDTATGREIRRFQAPGHVVSCLAYSSDGRMLASGGLDRTVRLWEVATGKERRCFEGHQGIVRSVAFSPDCTRLVSASEDTTALVWDTIPSTLAGRATAKQLQTAWNDLASDDAAKAYRAIWFLARNPQQSVPLLHERMPPARALDAETRKQIERWLPDLDSDQAAVRERASAELEKRGMMAEPMLRKALTAQPSLEQRKRIEQILEHLEREQVTFGRALEALEHAHSPESRQLLKTIAAGEPQAWLTREAKAALGRLDKVPP